MITVRDHVGQIGFCFLVFRFVKWQRKGQEVVIGFRVFCRLVDLGPAVEHLDFDRRQWLQSAHLQKEERMCADGAGTTTNKSTSF